MRGGDVTLALESVFDVLWVGGKYSVLCDSAI